MSAFVGELIGTAILLLLGNGVVANVVLNQTKGNNAGWVAISLAWGVAVFVAVFISAEASGAHLNPAVTFGLAIAGSFEWVKVPSYICAQMIGAAIGASLVWLQYRPHFDASTDNADGMLACFSTGPAIRNTTMNFISECIGTFALVFGVLFISGAAVGDLETSLGSLDALPVALLVLGIGLSLGGSTGYAINPARDLAPRIMHTILPIKGKRDSDWNYSWIPVLGPIAGGIAAGLLFLVLN